MIVLIIHYEAKLALKFINLPSRFNSTACMIAITHEIGYCKLLVSLIHLRWLFRIKLSIITLMICSISPAFFPRTPFNIVLNLAIVLALLLSSLYDETLEYEVLFMFLEEGITQPNLCKVSYDRLFKLKFLLIF